LIFSAGDLTGRSEQVSLAGPGYAKSGAVDHLARKGVERVEQLPGVESAALASARPLLGSFQDMLFSIPRRQPVRGFNFTGDVQWRRGIVRADAAARFPAIWCETFGSPHLCRRAASLARGCLCPTALRASRVDRWWHCAASSV